MPVDTLEFRQLKDLPYDAVLALYRANDWSAAEKPQSLLSALANSDAVVTAWDGTKLVGLANAISDGHLVVYYPHMVVLPEYQGRGIGRRMMEMLGEKYEGFHQQALLAEREAIGFYEKCGFTRAGKTEAMWIFQGTEHG